MENLPFYVPLTFGITVLLGLFLFHRATKASKMFWVVVLFWTGLQTSLSLSGFYRATGTTPSRFPFMLMPPVIAMIILFSTKRGRQFIDGLDTKMLTLFHVIRVPIEVVLFWLFVHGAVPQLMTFEGRNFDILSGLSAPFVYYYGFVNKKLSRTVLLAWNLVCLGLVFNIAANGFLSAATPFQRFAFEQPNIAVLYFPFMLLPALLVPLVIFSHLASLQQLLYAKQLSTAPEANSR